MPKKLDPCKIYKNFPDHWCRKCGLSYQYVEYLKSIGITIFYSNLSFWHTQKCKSSNGFIEFDARFWSPTKIGYYNYHQLNIAKNIILRSWRLYKVKKRAANIIKTAFKNAISNPEYKICKKRLLKEFHQL